METINCHDYPDQKRLARMKSKFLEKFGIDPTYLIRVPGRVNIIGEHIDYCGYSVLPMAIEQDILVALNHDDEGVDDDDDSIVVLSLSNVDSEKYPDFSCRLTADSNIEPGTPFWHKYFLCGVKGVIDELIIERKKGRKMNCLVDGRIPPAAGLSSSSALVVAAALSTVVAFGLDVRKDDLADLCAKSERYIGTQGGGMDQAIALLAEEGHAKLIDFAPLKATNCKLPQGANFVIINSLAKSNKAAGTDYNARVLECRLATKLLAESLGLAKQNFQKLGDLQKASELDLEEMEERTSEILKQNPYSKKEILDLVEGFDETESSSPWRSMSEFKLSDRAKHVYSEANRVYEFKAICDDDDNESDDILKKLGNLMDQSHSSCSDLYQCSHPDLDTLVTLSKKYGALGARLTGAGWGGCVVALVPNDKMDGFKDGIIKEYFEKKNLPTKDVIFESRPGPGSQIYVF